MDRGVAIIPLPIWGSALDWRMQKNVHLKSNFMFNPCVTGLVKMWNRYIGCPCRECRSDSAYTVQSFRCRQFCGPYGWLFPNRYRVFLGREIGLSLLMTCISGDCVWKGVQKGCLVTVAGPHSVHTAAFDSSPLRETVEASVAPRIRADQRLDWSLSHVPSSAEGLGWSSHVAMGTPRLGGACLQVIQI